MAVDKAAGAIPALKAVAKKPWIQQGTLDLISSRQVAREARNITQEKLLNKAVHRAARADRAIWLDMTCNEGGWWAMRKLKQHRRGNHGRLHNEKEDLVASESRADTMARYLETVQWCVRPATVVNAPPLRPTIQARSNGHFTLLEVRRAVQKFGWNKAPGPDGTLEALLCSEESLCLATVFLSKCWGRRQVPPE